MSNNYMYRNIVIEELNGQTIYRSKLDKTKKLKAEKKTDKRPNKIK